MRPDCPDWILSGSQLNKDQNWTGLGSLIFIQHLQKTACIKTQLVATDSSIRLSTRYKILIDYLLLIFIGTPILQFFTGTLLNGRFRPQNSYAERKNINHGP